MGKIFRQDELTELIGIYASVIARVTLIGCTALAMLREITDSEAQEITNEIESATDDFISAYRKKLARRGNTIGKAATDKLRSEINEQILSDCWVLMQKVTEEIKKQTGDDANGKINNTLQDS